MEALDEVGGSLGRARLPRADYEYAPWLNDT